MTAAELRAVYQAHPDQSPLARDDATSRAKATRAACRSDMTDEGIDAVRVECGLEPLFGCGRAAGAAS